MRRGALGPINLIIRLIYLLTHQFDIYHGDGHRPAVLLPILVAKKIFKKPFISEWMDIFGEGLIQNNRNKLEKILIGYYDRFFEKKARIWADGTIVLSEALFNKAKALKIKEKDILLLHGGSDVEGIKVKPKSICRNRLKLPQDKVILGIVGINRDDVDDLMVLFDAVQMISLHFQKKLLIITTGHSVKFNEIIKGKKIDHFFQNFGWIDRSIYNDFLCACDWMLIAMKDNERNRNKWPNKLGDFLAAGRPVLSNPVGDIVEYFDKYMIGKLVGHNAKELKEAIESIILNKEQSDILGKNARKVSEETISWEARTEELLNFYSKYIK